VVPLHFFRHFSSSFTLKSAQQIWRTHFARTNNNNNSGHYVGSAQGSAGQRRAAQGSAGQRRAAQGSAGQRRAAQGSARTPLGPIFNIMFYKNSTGSQFFASQVKMGVKTTVMTTGMQPSGSYCQAQFQLAISLEIKLS
jgi:hypothetical protein